MSAVELLASLVLVGLGFFAFLLVSRWLYQSIFGPHVEDNDFDEQGNDEVGQATKICPHCAEEVKAAALICRYCRYEFSPGSRSK